MHEQRSQACRRIDLAAGRNDQCAEMWLSAYCQTLNNRDLKQSTLNQMPDRLGTMGYRQ